MATNSQIAFNPQGETVVVAAAVAPPLGVQAPVYQKFSDHVAGQMRIVNASVNIVHLGYGATAAEAQANAVAAVAGNPAPASHCWLALLKSCAFLLACTSAALPLGHRRSI